MCPLLIFECPSRNRHGECDRTRELCHSVGPTCHDPWNPMRAGSSVAAADQGVGIAERADRRAFSVRTGGRVAAVALLASAFVVGIHPTPAGADTATFSNTTAITIPASAPANPGAASPYPSGIAVSGMTGNVIDVNITLTNLVHAITSDVDILLVGPAGQNLVVMSDAKGDTGFSINGTITYDDAAAGQMPATGVQGSGTFQPTNRTDSNGPDTFPAPAPAPSSAAALNVFNGTNPNGQWQLFVFDDAGG